MTLETRILTSLLLLACSLLFADAAPARALTPEQEKLLEGIWSGNLRSGGVQLRIVLRVERGTNGALQTTLESPDQGPQRLPVSELTLEGRRLSLAVNVVGGAFSGLLSDDGTTLDGRWTQRGATLPLVLRRVERVEARARPQTPRAPLPYVEERVTYRNERAGVTLAGTLTRPETGRPVPAVLLISGSGPQDRDETIMDHRPFLVLADHLTRRGLAVLRFDDRGIGESTGEFATATTVDFAGDVEAGVRYLRGRPEIDGAAIGLIGHSEGGLVAPLVAAGEERIAFTVLLAAPALPGGEIITLQTALILAAQGASRELVEWSRDNSRAIFALVREEQDLPRLERRAHERIDAAWAALSPRLRSQLEQAGETPESMKASLAVLRSDWFRHFVNYDPRPVLGRVTCPLLALYGEKDLQVPPAENLAALRSALAASRRHDQTLQELPGLNHLFQTAETGLIEEYGQIEETISPLALDAISNWILLQVRPAAEQPAN